MVTRRTGSSVGLPFWREHLNKPGSKRGLRILSLIGLDERLSHEAPIYNPRREKEA